MQMIHAIKGDVKTYNGDCLVNAANAALCGGGGVDGAIHRAAGPGLLADCKTLGGCKTGSAKITDGHNLKVKKIIHAVGPVWDGGDKNEVELLRSCYDKSLNLCQQWNLRSIAFPNISCGAYRFPGDRACQIALDAACEWLEENPGQLDEIAFYCFEDKLFRVMSKLIER